MTSYTDKRVALILHLKFQKFLIGDTRTAVHRRPPPAPSRPRLTPDTVCCNSVPNYWDSFPQFTRTDMRTGHSL